MRSGKHKMVARQAVEREVVKRKVVRGSQTLGSNRGDFPKRCCWWFGGAFSVKA